MFYPFHIPYQKLQYFGLCHVCHLYHPFERMTILWMESFWAQQLSCCTCHEVQILLTGLWVSVAASGETIP
jgi:hypothetical protein